MTLSSFEKLVILGEGAKYDVCASTSVNHKKVFSGSKLGLGTTSSCGVCHSFTPDGRCISLLKVLMTNVCQKDCCYCPNRRQRDVKRTSFTANELASLFIEFYRRNYVEGLFLSSGVKNTTFQTMDEMLQCIEIIRYKHNFNGYIHLKILPGAKEEQIEAACTLANRVSINCEAPQQKHLNKLSKTKNFNKDILNTFKTIDKYQGTNKCNQSTQFIVGASGETDKDILSRVDSLYNNFGVKRAYFSAFTPVMGTPLESLSSTPLLRENRLYQSDFLIRLYNFKVHDLTFINGNLQDNMDPKLAFALNNLALYPIEVNTANFDKLLKVPGIGPVSAKRIIKLRRTTKILDPNQLKAIRVVVKRALPFISLNGKVFDSIEKFYKNQNKVKQLSFDF
ncbi:putative DNA modification/repair radical SAM protein [Proteinivorax tanatarense]|uniref:DNA modification/repair radical SAM protein n=1 Tax=Proteinivorax tanatarense TaxID=1260629 RepID=A0AAU7VNT8_9FIRM